MLYIKKLVMNGFKSFAKETDVPFSRGMNVIVGVNGAGKSNISDAICFVLGRLGMKSMRAARAANLIFMGTKNRKPSHEAAVEIIFDNSDKKFNLDSNEISVKRIVKQNGQSIYKIQNEVKTRQEILELLAQADIDPNGFNIILQGEIDSFVKMHPEERRKVIEEVAGISVYEKRKEKSLHELEKTDEKLKEIGTVLRERTSYLSNLEKERKEAMKFKYFENLVKRCRATLIFKDKKEKEKNVEEINSEIEKEGKKIEKIKKEIGELEEQITSLNEKINEINKQIQEATGVQAETLHQEISDLRAELAGSIVRKENLDNRMNEVLRRREELKKSLPQMEKEIEELKKKSPAIAKKQEQLRAKREQVEKLEEERREFYSLKADVSSFKNRIADRKQQLSKLQEDSDFAFRQIEELSKQLFDKRTENNETAVKALREKISQSENEIKKLGKSEIEIERSIAKNEVEIKNLEEIKQDVSKIDICPLCKSKITSEHVSHVKTDCNNKINNFSKQLKSFSDELKSIKEGRKSFENSFHLLKDELSKREADSIKLQSIKEKTEYIKKLEKETAEINKEITELENKKSSLEKLSEQQKNIEEKYENARLGIEEFSFKSEESIDIQIASKEMEIEKIKSIIKRSNIDEKELEEQISDLTTEIDEKQELLEKKQEKEEKLTQEFRKHLSERNRLHEEIRKIETESINKQHELRSQEDKINNLKITKAQSDAQLTTLNAEFAEFEKIAMVGGEDEKSKEGRISKIEIINASREKVKEKLKKAEEILIRIGSVNLRAIEVYDDVKREYDAVFEKAQILEKEKNEIMKIIQEIDMKKKKTFNKTLQELNVLFERNFMQLSEKGRVFLEVENKEDPFSAGVNIIVKVGKGKYLDATSLSGGEQTIVALSLIFAIQEYRPYSFYLFDEIDAALDKRNSEKLAALIKKYMKIGQYIIITHNDAIITESDVLYGVSMNEGESKILSLQV